MLDECTIKERFDGVTQLLDRWLQERQDLIVQFCALSGINEYRPASDSAASRLEHFCQVLVDYASAGHFEVYYQLIREAEEFEDGSAETAQALLPSIINSTEIAMDFHDKYADAKGPFTHLPRDLSKLGETLAERFENEDRLIDTLHEAHREQVA